MPKFYYDLHIHSALSPCGDSEMTPNNIVNMSVLKKLDIIAVTDHNTDKNIEVINNLSYKKDLLLIPGIEVETKEEVHTLCLFKSVSILNHFVDRLNHFLPDLENNETFFGKQLLFDEHDNILGTEKKLLCNSTLFSIDQVIDLVRKYGGIVIAAHVDKQINSIIRNLGFIPTDLDIDGIELSYNITPKVFFDKYPQYKRYRWMQNSDAHYLKDIAERTNYIELTECSIDSFFSYFRR